MSHWRGGSAKRAQDGKEELLQRLLNNVSEAKKKPCIASAKTIVAPSLAPQLSVAREQRGGPPRDSGAAVQLPRPLPPLAFYSAAPDHTFVDDFLKRCSRQTPPAWSADAFVVSGAFRSCWPSSS